MERLAIVYNAPIPVGHRIEVTWLRKPAEPGFFGSGSEKSYPHEPLLRDLDTGIEYAPDCVLSHGGTLQAHVPLDVSDEPNDWLEVERVLVGVVRRCRIVTVRWSDYSVQTHLDIDPEESASAYR